jgi:hypothetical protein
MRSLKKHCAKRTNDSVMTMASELTMLTYNVNQVLNIT